MDSMPCQTGDKPRSHLGWRLAKPFLPLVLAGGLVMGSAGQAQACYATILVSGNAAIASVAAEIATIELAVMLGFQKLNDAWQRLANQGSNNQQNFINDLSISADRTTTSKHASELAKTRALNAMQAYPSRVACSIAGRQKPVNEAYEPYADTLDSFAYSSTHTDATSFALNAPGTDSEKGALAALNKAFTTRCSKYADRDSLDAPSSINCPGATDPDMVNLDVDPSRSLLNPITYRNADYQAAAGDTIRLLTQVAPDDPIRGAALSRMDGQNIHVQRMRDLTRMNISRGILEDIQARRAIPGTPGTDGRSISRNARYIEMTTGQKIEDYENGHTDIAKMDAVRGAAQPENGNLQSVAASMATQKMMLTEMRRMTEQMVLMAATNLAMQVESSRTGNTGLAARAIRSN